MYIIDILHLVGIRKVSEVCKEMKTLRFWIFCFQPHHGTYVCALTKFPTHFGLFISVINQLDAQNCCFTISSFHAFTCFEHMCSKHVEAWNELIVKQKFCASSWLSPDINMTQCQSHFRRDHNGYSDCQIFWGNGWIFLCFGPGFKCHSLKSNNWIRHICLRHLMPCL